MSGRCYSCASSFGLFRKEMGCKNCGYAFCKDCLKKKTAIPKRKNEVHKVCNSCFDILTGKTDQTKKKNNWSPPEAYKKRVAALNDPKPKPGPSVQGAKSKKSYPPNMRKEDIAIAERLEKLKESRKVEVPSQQEIEARMSRLKERKNPVPTEEQMRARLDKLHADDSTKLQRQGDSGNAEAAPNVPPHGSNTQNTKAPPPVAPTTGKPMQPDEVHQLMGRYNELVNIDHKYAPQRDEDTPVKPDESKNSAKDEEAEIKRLMEQYSHQVKVDSDHAHMSDQKDAELKARLHKLKGTSKGGERKKELGEEGEAEEEESEEVAAEKVLKQILGSSKIQDRNTLEVSDSSAAEQVIEELEEAPESDPEDQLPWCCICNNDATLRCYGCDGDLYCKRCYREGHDRQDYADHKTKPFKPMTGSPDTSP